MRIFFIFLCFIVISSLHSEDFLSLSWKHKSLEELYNLESGEILAPQAIAVDKKENIYILSNFTKTILIFSSKGDLIEKISYDAEGCGLALGEDDSIAVFSPMAKTITWVRGVYANTTKKVEGLPSISEVWMENNTWWARCGWQVTSVVPEDSKMLSILSLSFPEGDQNIVLQNQDGNSIHTLEENTNSCFPIGKLTAQDNLYIVVPLKKYNKVYSWDKNNKIFESLWEKKGSHEIFCNYFLTKHFSYQMVINSDGILIDRTSLNWSPSKNVRSQMIRSQLPLPTFKKTSSMEAIPTYIDVFFRNENVVRTVKLQDYLKNVVSAEIYGSWSLEAHRAMAVTARSYTIGRKRHTDAQICTSTHCQAWKAEVNWKASQAVDDTNGIAIYHNGRVISEALYFAHCNGKTRNSEEKWNYNPYLRSKTCSCGHNSYYGHGVGACQYGLESYSKQGWTYKRIIEHYYTGVVVK